MILLMFTAVALFFSGGVYYVFNVLDSLWMQTVNDVLEVTSQGGHAFEIYIQKNMEAVHGLEENLAQRDFDDLDYMKNRLQAFNGEDNNYYVIDLDHGILYSGEKEEGMPLDAESLAYLNGFSGSGIQAPYLSEKTGQKMLGFYECFTFADGTRGVIQKEQLLSEIASEFSLSFYDNTGFSYIVDREGDILIRSWHKNSNRTFMNVFDVIDMDGNSRESLESFRTAIGEGKKGVARFLYDSEEYVYAYVPLEIVEDGWYLISIIPNSVIMKQADQIMKSSQMFAFLILSFLCFATLFAILLRQNYKSITKKNQEIRYREQLFSILINNAEDVFVMFTVTDHKDTYHIEYISPNVKRILGIPLEEVRRNFGILYMDNNDDQELSFLKKISQMKPDSSIMNEVQRVHEMTGEQRWFMETVYRVTIENTDKFILTLSDRTREKQSKKALEQALEIAEVANQSKSTFLSNMSHDIRTPMNAIVGLCTLLQRDAGNPERVRDHVRKIAASSQHLLGLINDVLDMSKIESGKTTLNITEINLADIVEELETIIRPQIKAKKQTFEISAFDVKTEHLLGDKLRINQILINILSNAVKYTDTGGDVKMVIRQMPQTTKNYANLRFIVCDNGIGMSEEYIKTIFHPFSREINSTTNKIQGTGLGMAITKNLIDLMGGTIVVDSELGKGSTFTVDLELRMQEQEIDQDFWINHGLTHALIVDDEAEVCTNVINAMAGTGVFMQSAQSGPSAIEMVRKSHEEGDDFNLVLLDWKMPEMDGIETARRIRGILPSNIPIMILTAYDWSDIEEEALAAGIDGFLPKPFFLTNFKQTIEKLKRGTRDEPVSDQKESVLKGRHILAAEDNELNSEILVELLDMVGAVCDVAKNGKEAVEMFEQSVPGQYDLILMDVQMPVMNGYEAVKEIRSGTHQRAQSIPIVAMTANAFTEDIKNALDSGMNAHVAKPVDLEKLEAVVKDIFSKIPKK